MSTPTFYIFHGEDNLSIDEAVVALRAGMGDDSNADLNIAEMDGTQVSVAEVVNTVSSYPFLADKRLVIVRGLLGWLTRKGAGQTGKDELARLEEDLPNLPDFARLVLIERQTISDKSPIIKLAGTSERGYVKHFSVPKDTTSWILKRARAEYNRDMDNRAAVALSAVIGDDLRRADNELIKLASYVADGEPITEDDVAALTPYVPEGNIFKMVDAIAEGHGQVALELLHRLLTDKNQDEFALFGMIIRQFRLLLQAKEHLVSGGSPGGMAQAIGVRPFVAQSLTRQCKGFTLDQLEMIYRNLLSNDIKMKTGRIKPDLALDLFVASVAK
jgi:DNA polymerase-3 subunit delta